MPRAARALVSPALAALAGALLLGLAGLADYAWSDYEMETLPAAQALRTGDVGGFLALAPVYGGSLVLRSPFAVVAALWGGGDLAVFRAFAVPCLLAGAALGVALFARSWARGLPPLGAWLALGLVAINPLILRALELGHPEELLGGVLAVAAVLAAGSERPAVAGFLLGAAIANKPWALLAAPPVLLVLATRRDRAVAAATAAALAAVVVVPLLLAGGRAVAETGAVGFGPSAIFNPAQVWWFLGEHGLLTGPREGYRAAPEWIGLLSRATVLAIPLALSAAVALRRRALGLADALALLALLFLVRCLIDPWNVVYYELPFLLSLAAWEVHARRGLPVVALGATLASWVTLDTMAGGPTDLQAACFLAWSVPLAAVLAGTLLAPDGVRLRRRYATEVAR